MSQENQIEKIVEEGEWLTITTTDGKELKANIGALNYNDLRQLGLNTDIEYEIKAGGINWGDMLVYFCAPSLVWCLDLLYVLPGARGQQSGSQFWA